MWKVPPHSSSKFFPKDVVKTETNFPFDYLIKSELHLIIEKMYFLKKEKKFLTENRLDNKNGWTLTFLTRKVKNKAKNIKIYFLLNC